MQLLKAGRNFLQVAAFALLLWQMGNAIVKYISNPTVTSTSHRNIESITPPLITICQTGQYDWERAEEQGYKRRIEFFKGLSSKNNGITWGGKDNLTFHESIRHLFKAETKNIHVHKTVKKEERFIIPYGHCLDLRNMSMNQGDSTLNRIEIEKGKYRLYITDPAMGLHYKITEPSMVGDIIQLDTEFNKSTIYKKHYLIEIEQTVLNPAKSGEECSSYDEDNSFKSYAECIYTEHINKLFPDLGCNIPWILHKDNCQGLINSTYSKETDKYLHNIIYYSIIALNLPSTSCKHPCVKLRVTSKYLNTIETVNGINSFILHFDRDIKVSESISQYNGFDLTVEVGSALGLWLGLSAIGLFDYIIGMITFSLTSMWKK